MKPAAGCNNQDLVRAERNKTTDAAMLSVSHSMSRFNDPEPEKVQRAGAAMIQIAATDKKQDVKAWQKATSWQAGF